MKKEKLSPYLQKTCQSFLSCRTSADKGLSCRSEKIKPGGVQAQRSHVAHRVFDIQIALKENSLRHDFCGLSRCLNHGLKIA